MSSYNSNNYGSGATENHELDLPRLLGEMVDHRALILSFTLFFTVCAGLYAWLVTPIYRADALLQVEGKQDNSLLKSLGPLNSDLLPDAAPDLLLLKSRMILGKSVDDLGLTYAIAPRYTPVVGRLWALLTGAKTGELTVGWLHIPALNQYPRKLLLTVNENGQFDVVGEGINAKGRVGQTLAQGDISILITSISAAPGSQFLLTEKARLETINALNQRFTVTESAKQSGVLNLSLTGKDPELISRILNSIAENYLAQNIARQAAQDARSLEFLQRHLPEIRDELDIAEERLNAYRKQRDSVDLTLEAKSVLEQIVNVDNQLNELTFREAEISQLFKKDHPTYRALSEKRQTLEKEKSRLNKRVSTMPSTQQQILRLSRDVDSGRAVYLQLLTRQQELNISRSSAIGNVRIIDSAVTQPDPIKPNKFSIVALGAMLGMVISCGVVFGRMAFRRGVEIPEQLEATGMTVLATLPRSIWLWKKTRVRSHPLAVSHWKHKTKDVPFLPVDRPLDLFVEAIRSLRTNLHFAMLDAENNVVMISGASQNCGKTLVSTSLASIAARAGQKVLLIDADMRKGYIHDIFHIDNRNGLAEILCGKTDGQQAVQRYSEGEVDVITCGQMQAHPSEMLMGARLQELVSWANERYDLVIVDTPPVLAVVDAILVGRTASTSLLVARFGKTSTKEVHASVKRLNQAGVKVNGVILNDVVKSAALSYSYGQSYYDYSYSDVNQREKH